MTFSPRLLGVVAAICVLQSCSCGEPPKSGNSGGGSASAGGTATNAGGTTGTGGSGGGSATAGGTGTGGGSSLAGGTGATGGGSGATAGGSGGTAGGSPGCPAMQYFNGQQCRPLTTCNAYQWESAAPTPTSDRGCTNLTACTFTQYQTVAPTPTSDRVCVPLTVCTANEYQSRNPTPTTDRECTPVTPPCTGMTWELMAPTATGNRYCAPWSVCSQFEYETQAPTNLSDRQCTPLTVCTSSQFQSTAPTATTDRVCSPLTNCTSSQCETVPATATSDRQCGPLVFTVTPGTQQVITVNAGQSTPTVTFTAMACTNAVTAGWTIDNVAAGSLTLGPSQSVTFTPSGRIGGVVTVTAGYQGRTATSSVQIRLQAGTQNGPSAGQGSQVVTDAGMLVQGGGVGGVGGEGLGPTLPAGDTNLIALQGTPGGSGAAQGLALLYPYDATVWPRGMLAPLLQWEWSFGDADAVRIDLSTTNGSYTWSGYFGRPAILGGLPPAFRRFTRHPIPQDVWQAATDSAGGADRLTVRVTVARSGVAYGPLTQTWVVAPGRLTGTIYYQSYGTNLATNYTGAVGTPTAFGAGVLSIRVGDTGPKLVSSATSCQVCHSVAARGARLVTQASTNGNNDTINYELHANGTATASPLARGVPEPGYPGVSPDGTLMLTRSAQLQTLPNNPAPDLMTTGLTSYSTNLGVPAFSPDGTKVVFNPQNMVTNAGRVMTVMDFNRTTRAFTNAVTVANDTSVDLAQRSAWPAFFPDSRSLVYQHVLRVSADGHTSDEHTRKFAQGELRWTSAISSTTPVRLDRLNGALPDGGTYLPKLATASTLSCTADGLAVGANALATSSDPSHSADSKYNYEPTVNPVSTGGYAWVVFTSRRMYGNVATIPPFCSDPRGVDLHANMMTNGNVTTKKLWVAAVDLNAAPGSDSSHPAFYLPAQELLAGNARGFWVLDPCRADGNACATGDQCCNGFCQPSADGGAQLVCSDRPPNYTCSQTQEVCTQSSDCCRADNACVGGFCVLDL
ncbi:MAG: hypothetical protein JNK82_43255 [Myxococcaceae bacterium]|nr:hypothetical protein [Myxococcaceae bacterium]